MKEILGLLLFSQILLTAPVAPLSTPQPTPAATLTKPALAIVPRKPEIIGALYSFSLRASEGSGQNSSSRHGLKNGFMQNHTFSLRYALNDSLAVRLSNSFVDNRVTFVKNNREQDMAVAGMSDLKTYLVWTIFKNPIDWLEWNVGLSLPTAVLENDPQSGRPLPPFAQLGSGTLDLLTSFSYIYNLQKFVLSQKLEGVFHSGENSLGYRLGDDFGFSSTISYAFSSYFVPQFSLKYSDRKPQANGASVKALKIKSVDDDPVVQRNPFDRSGSSWEGSMAVRSVFTLAYTRISVEAGTPVFHTSNSDRPAHGRTLWFGSINAAVSF